ncbi:MAG: lysophospholipid acyltransferase family protein [Planctomycetota bacterium]
MRQACQHAFFHAVVKPFVWTFTGTEVDGGQRLQSDGPQIIVSNHNSHLDTAMLLLLAGGRRGSVRPVAAAEYFCRGRVMPFLTTRLFNILPIDRGGLRDGRHSFECMSEALARGESLIIYPEGTRGEPESLRPFQKGVGHIIAANRSVPVVPVGISGLGRVMPKGRWLPVPHQVRVCVGEPRRYDGNPKEITDDLERVISGLRDRADRAAQAASRRRTASTL